MKKHVWVVVMFLLTNTLFAQADLQQRVYRAVQKAADSSPANAERKLINAYHDGLVTVVDEVLTRNPGLANTRIMGQNGQIIPMAYDAFLRERMPMLEVLYNHGAECLQCLNDSFKKGTLTPGEQLSLRYQLPIYGASFDRIVQLKGWQEWLKIAKKVEVTTEDLPTFLVKEWNPWHAEWYSDEWRGEFERRLTLAYSPNQVTQELIDSYRAAYKSACKQEFKVHQTVTRPHIEITFLGKKYEPKKSNEDKSLIKQIETAYDYEVMTKYLAYGKDVPSNLKVQRDGAISQVKRACKQLEEYEETVRKNMNEEYNSGARVFTGIQVLGGHVDLLPLLLKTFPKAYFSEWKYYPKGGTIVPFQIPVIIDGNKNVYDARPENFGKQLL